MTLEDLLDDHKLFVENMAIRISMLCDDKHWTSVLKLLPHDLRHITPNVFACLYVPTVKFKVPMGKWTSSTSRKHGKANELNLEWHFDEKFHAAVTKYFRGNFDIVFEPENPAPFEGVNHRLGGLISESPYIHSVLEIYPEANFTFGEREQILLSQLKIISY